MWHFLKSIGNDLNKFYLLLMTNCKVEQFRPSKKICCSTRLPLHKLHEEWSIFCIASQTIVNKGLIWNTIFYTHKCFNGKVKKNMANFCSQRSCWCAWSSPGQRSQLSWRPQITDRLTLEFSALQGVMAKSKTALTTIMTYPGTFCHAGRCCQVQNSVHNYHDGHI